MPNWTFADDYAARYPALASSVLSLLVFSDHSLTGSAFAGTLDVAASGVALETLGQLSGATAIPLSGSVSDDDTTLTVTLASTTGAFGLDAISAIPLLGPKITAVGMSVSTIAAASDSADTGPGTDDLSFSIALSLGGDTVTLAGAVPMNGGLCTIEVETTGIAIGIDDLDFLTSKVGAGWFPADQLGPFSQTSLTLIGLSVDLYLALDPFSIAFASVAIGIGFTGQALIENVLYLSPLAVWVTIAAPDGAPTFTWALMGTLALCSHLRPGNYQNPDLALDMSMDLNNFAVSATLENEQSITVNTALQDLGVGSIGLGDDIILTTLEMDITVDSGGKATGFDLDVGMSGSLGLFSVLTVEKMELKMSYLADGNAPSR
ncbi:MAG: hypothetical protein WDM91_11615 [Rhizomicrobium sp.]